MQAFNINLPVEADFTQLETIIDDLFVTFDLQVTMKLHTQKVSRLYPLASQIR